MRLLLCCILCLASNVSGGVVRGSVDSPSVAPVESSWGWLTSAFEFVSARWLTGSQGRIGAGVAPPPYFARNISALGDSISVGYDIKALFASSIQDNWATGTTAAANSVFTRLRAQLPGAAVTVSANVAVPSAKMADLLGQVNSPQIVRSTQLVTILMGGNDLCTSTVGTMTTAAAFRASFNAALTALDAKLTDPHAVIYVSSIPDVYQLWALFYKTRGAQLYWGVGKICQSLLAKPTSTAAADVARRAAVRARNRELNAVLSSTCSGFSRCRFDGNATFTAGFVANDVSTVDYFHPSVAGQEKIARLAWCALYPPPPGAACV